MVDITVNNYFDHVHVERATDAFLAWLFKEANTSKHVERYISHVFNVFGLSELKDEVSEIKVYLQHKGADLIVEFLVNGKRRKVLFENKTWTTIHSDQLNRYKRLVPDCYKYVYLKLSYLHSEERDQAVEAGYHTVGAEDLERALEPLKNTVGFVREYLAYLNSSFIAPKAKILLKLAEDDPDVFAEQGAQIIVLSELREQLVGKSNFLRLDVGRNKGGRPWTQLNFCKTLKLYGDTEERIFWRIDKRQNDRYYVRLNQYANVAKENNEANLKKKKDRRAILMNIISQIVSQFQLKPGRPSNSGIKESELVIFFVDENPITYLRNTLPEISVKFAAEYSKIK